MRKSVAIFGGSFDPPHASHVLAAVYARKVGGFDQVLVVPVFEHAFQKQLTPFQHRLRMCELAFQGIEGVLVSPIEAELATPSLTLRTVEALTAAHSEWALRLLVGSDVLSDTAKWHAFDRISALAPPYVLARPGCPHPDPNALPLPDVSSTRVREALAHRGQGSADAVLTNCVPRAVLEYIEEQHLYQGGG
jgi:nicotinate-nucleotide adenylyltransferase